MRSYEKDERETQREIDKHYIFVNKKSIFINNLSIPFVHDIYTSHISFRSFRALFLFAGVPLFLYPLLIYKFNFLTLSKTILNHV